VPRLHGHAPGCFEIPSLGLIELAGLGTQAGRAGAMGEVAAKSRGEERSENDLGTAARCEQG
jgi:hypothetical protein